MIKSPDIEFKTKEAIEQLQLAKLREVLRYVGEHSPFYSKLFRERGVEVKNVDSLEWLTNLPVTTKDDMQRYNWDFLCVPRSRIVEYTSTSGTLGKPVTIGLTANDLQRLAYNESISFGCADGTSDDIYQLMLTLDRQFMAGIAYYHGIRRMGASLIRSGPGVPAMQLDLIDRLRPTTLVAVPSFLIKVISYAHSTGFDLTKTSVRSAICIGESLRNQDLSLNILGTRIAEQWNIDLYGTYASTEMQTAFTECRHGVGGHHHPELIIVEVLDDDNKPVPEGTPGEVTITTLGVEGMPLIRYKTGDIAAAFESPCECGRTTLRLGPVLGRKQQLIKLKGTTIYPTGIFELLNSISCVRDYIVEAYTSELGTDDIRLYIATDDYQDDVVKTVSTAMQSRLRVLPQINITTASALEKMMTGSGERKMRRFIDGRHA
jgi:phenylacetate-CoA ligase